MSVFTFPVFVAFWKGRPVDQTAGSKARTKFQQGLWLVSCVT